MDKNWLLVIPIVGLAVLILKNEAEPHSTSGNPHPAKGKEEYYLLFNKDEIFKNLIATEGHFRNVSRLGIDTEGFLNCAVKHLADTEGHLDEAISHSLIAKNEETSNNFRTLRNEVQQLRHDLQAGTVSPEEGIRRTRQVRRYFESFNQEFDVSRCKACEIRVDIIKEGVVQPPFIK